MSSDVPGSDISSHFDSVHTKLRNRLGHEKASKLVFSLVVFSSDVFSRLCFVRLRFRSLRFHRHSIFFYVEIEFTFIATARMSVLFAFISGIEL